MSHRQFSSRALAWVALLACSDPKIQPAGGTGPGGPGKSGGAGPGNPDFTFTTPDGGAAAGPGPSVDKTHTCGLQSYKLQHRPAELMLVLDRSGSMLEPAVDGAATSKWDDVTAAIGETIMKTQAAVLWGLKLFPTGYDMCTVADAMEVPPAIMNYSTVTAAIAGGPPPGEGTPTSVAIAKTVTYLQSVKSSNARYLLLATDGEPNCGLDMSLDPDPDGAVSAIQAAAGAGFHTFVVGVATGPDAADTLDRMALAGGEPRAGTPQYYPVASRGDLVAALQLITGLVSNCVFPLGTRPPSPDDVAVDVGMVRIARDPSHHDGWDYDASGTSVQVYGPACDRIKMADGQDVKITYGCPGVAIP
jgi:hypothetical protein